MTDLHIPGVRLHYDEVGEGDTVLFLHGALATGLAFRGQRAALQDVGRLVFLDQRGHGKSAHFGDDVGWDTLRYGTFVKDAHAAIDALSPDAPVHLVGVSMGGVVSAHVASERPERVASLSLLSTPGRASARRRHFFSTIQPEETNLARLAARWHGEDYWLDLARNLFAYFAASQDDAFPVRLAPPRALVMQANADELLESDEAQAWARRIDAPVDVETPPGAHAFFADGRAGSEAANRALRAFLTR